MPIKFTIQAPIEVFLRVIVLCSLEAAVLDGAGTQAAPASRVETFNCGRLGKVILRSATNPTLANGFATYAAEIQIPNRKIRQPGVLHNVMGGMDRTYTRRRTDNFRAVDETTPQNPIIMNLRLGGYFYGKHREEITISLLQEAYTCIPG